jgi:hypothetical protein
MVIVDKCNSMYPKAHKENDKFLCAKSGRD